jgi:hypothetical protein
MKNTMRAITPIHPSNEYATTRMARPTRISPNNNIRPMITFTKNMIAAIESESDADFMLETTYEMPAMSAIAPIIFKIGIMLSVIDPDMIDAFLKMNASKIMIGIPMKIKCMYDLDCNTSAFCFIKYG